MQVRVRVVKCVLAIFQRHHAADQLGCLRHHHVATDDRAEVAAGAGVHRCCERLRQRQRPHCIGFGLLLPADRKHRLVHPRLDHRRGHARRGPTDRTGRVHPHDRLADTPERLSEVHLRHHDAFEEVGRLAHDHRVDVGPALARHLERVRCRFAQHSGH